MNNMILEHGLKQYKLKYSYLHHDFSKKKHVITKIIDFFQLLFTSNDHV